MHGDEWQGRCREVALRLVSQLGSIREAARSIGVNHEGYRRLVNGGPVPRGPDRAKYLALVGVTPDATSSGAVPPDEGSQRAPAYQLTPRTFASEAERISYALGVLDMAGTSNRLVIETSNEVSRAISAASAALLSPISGPTPTANATAPTVAEKIEKHRASRSVPIAPAAAPAAAASRSKGRRSAQ
jgi:hypothetical protein